MKSIRLVGAASWVVLCLAISNSDADSICPTRTMETQGSGVILSPEYPKRFYKDYKCILTYNVPASSRITFTAGIYEVFSLFHHCVNWEYVRIETPSGTRAECGKKDPNTLLLQYETNKEAVDISIEFRSDRTTHPWRSLGKIFQIYYSVTSTNETTVMPTPTTSGRTTTSKRTPSKVTMMFRSTTADHHSPKSPHSRSTVEIVIIVSGVTLFVVGLVLVAVVAAVKRRRFRYSRLQMLNREGVDDPGTLPTAY